MMWTCFTTKVYFWNCLFNQQSPLKFVQKRFQKSTFLFSDFRAMYCLTFVEYILPILFIFFDRISSSFLLDSRIGVPESSAGMIAYYVACQWNLPTSHWPFAPSCHFKNGGFLSTNDPQKTTKKKIAGFMVSHSSQTCCMQMGFFTQKHFRHK